MTSYDTHELSVADGKIAMAASRGAFIAWLTDPADVPVFPADVTVNNGLWCDCGTLALSSSSTPPALPPFPQPSETFWMLLWRLVVCAARVSAAETLHANPARVGTPLSSIVKWVYGTCDYEQDTAVQVCIAFLSRMGIVVRSTTRAEVWRACLEGRVFCTDPMPAYHIDVANSCLRTHEPWLARDTFAHARDVCTYALLAAGVATARRRWQTTKHNGFRAYVAHIKSTWSRGRKSSSGHGTDIVGDATVAELEDALDTVECFKKILGELKVVNGSSPAEARAIKEACAGSVTRFYNKRLSFEIHLGAAWMATPAGQEIASRYHQKTPGWAESKKGARKKQIKTQRCTSGMCPFRSADGPTECAVMLDIEEAPATPSAALAAVILSRRARAADATEDF